jgi:hypothetical protein
MLTRRIELGYKNPLIHLRRPIRLTHLIHHLNETRLNHKFHRKQNCCSKFVFKNELYYYFIFINVELLRENNPKFTKNEQTILILI